jgi:hypothetical protein
MLASPLAQQLLLITLARVAAVAVLASEALIVWFRRNEPAAANRSLGRVAWALTPAIVLVGLSLWCAQTLATTAASPSQAVAMDDGAR